MDSFSNELRSQLPILCSSIEQNAIKSAELGYWGMDLNDLQILFNSLKTNHSVISLNLGRNNFGPLGVKAIAEFLKTNSTIQYLDLTGNSIGNEGVSILAEILKYTTSIRDLKLSGNGIDDNGIIPLANSLIFNHSIEYISLSVNKISDLGILFLAKVLTYNSSITDISVGYNLYSEKGLMLLQKALEKNYSILSALGTQIEKSGQEEMISEEVFFRNRLIYEKVFDYIMTNSKSFQKLNYFIIQKFHRLLMNQDVRRYNLIGDFNSDDNYLKHRYVIINYKTSEDYFSQRSKYMKMANYIEELIQRKWFRLVGICKDFKMKNSDLRLSENILSIIGNFLSKSDFLLIWELNKFETDFQKLKQINLYLEENIPFGKSVDDEREEFLQKLKIRNQDTQLKEKQNGFKLKKWIFKWLSKCFGK